VGLLALWLPACLSVYSFWLVDFMPVILLTSICLFSRNGALSNCFAGWLAGSIAFYRLVGCLADYVSISCLPVCLIICLKIYLSACLSIY
jgi:hypothetical protein